MIPNPVLLIALCVVGWGIGSQLGGRMKYVGVMLVIAFYFAGVAQR